MNFTNEEKPGLPIQWMFLNWLRLPPLFRPCWNTWRSAPLSLHCIDIINNSLDIVTSMQRQLYNILLSFASFPSGSLLLAGNCADSTEWNQYYWFQNKSRNCKWAKGDSTKLKQRRNKQNLNQVINDILANCIDNDMEKSRQHHLKFLDGGGVDQVTK